MLRKQKRLVRAGAVAIGGGQPVSVQSMLSVSHTRFGELERQALRLKEAGCELVRMAVPDRAAVDALSRLKERAGLSIVADIHFDYKLAVEAAAAGADKIRINPGNIGDSGRVKAVAAACRAAGIPVRIGVNSGSLECDILKKHGRPTGAALAESALYHASLLEKWDFYDIVLSVKASDVRAMVEANRALHDACDYPLHLGVTEAGTERDGLIKSAAGIGSLLLDGIGDTIRVSLTADPVVEVDAGRTLLRSLGLLESGVELISCPTCGRTQVDLIPLAQRVKDACAGIRRPLRVAVMGCAVNGPGEAREADVGIACGAGEGLLFCKGAPVEKVPEDRLFDRLMEEIRKLEAEYPGK